MDKTVHIIGFPMDLGSGRRGVDMGPSALRIAGLTEKIQSLGYSVIDEGDIPVANQETCEIYSEKLKFLPAIKQANELLAQKVESILDNNGFFRHKSVQNTLSLFLHSMAFFFHFRYVE